MKTSYKGFIAPLLLALIALLLVGGGAYVYVQKNQSANATPTIETAPAQVTPVQTVKEINTSNLFSKEINIQDYSYIPPEFLYRDGDYSYYIYLRGTEGSMPIVKVSDTMKEYTGVRSAFYYSFSPNKHRMAFVNARLIDTSVSSLGQDSYLLDKDAYMLLEKKEGLCLVQIDPKVIKCVSLTSPNETFINGFGDFGEPFMNSKWLDNSTIEVSVYKKPAITQAVQGYSPPIEIVRTQIITF